MSGLLQPHHTRDCARQPFPIGGFLLQFVQRWIEGTVADLENISRNLLQALPDGPAMQRLERQYLQKQQIQGPLDKIGWLAHSRLHSVTENTTTTPLGKQEEVLKECF